MNTLLKIGRYTHCPAEELAHTMYAWDKSWLAVADSPQLPVAAQLFEAVLLQLLNALSADSAQVHLFESQAGMQFAQLKQLYAATEQKLGQPFYSPREAAQYINQLQQRVGQRYTLLASAQVTDIYCYNQQQRKPEPIHFMVISGLAALVQHDAQLIHVLRNLFAQGARVGVIFLVLHDMDASRKLDLPLQFSKSYYAMLGEAGVTMQGLNFYQPVIPFGHPPTYQQFIHDFGYQPELPAGFSQTLTQQVLTARESAQSANPQQDFLKIKIGVSRAKDAYFSLGAASNTYNALMSGGSGSGKTSALQNIILSLCEQYAPKDLQLLLLDFGTVTFHPYRDVAHVQTVFNQPQNTLQIIWLLQFLKAELHRRKELFAQCGQQHNMTVDNLQDYAQYTGVQLPRLLTVVDEFAAMMKNRDIVQMGQQTLRVNTLIHEVLNFIACEGRKVGLHLLLVTQTFRDVDVPSDIWSNPHARVGLKAQLRQDSLALFKNDNDAAYQIQRYQAVVNAQNGLPEANWIVDLDYLTAEELRDRQAALRLRHTKHELSLVESYLQQQQEALDNAAAKTKQRVYPSEPDKASTPSWLK